MNNKKIIEKAKEFVKQEMLKGDSGHDWSHVLRVNNTAKK